MRLGFICLVCSWLILDFVLGFFVIAHSGFFSLNLSLSLRAFILSAGVFSFLFLSSHLLSLSSLFSCFYKLLPCY